MASILTIVTAATVRALTTRDAVKGDLSLSGSGDDAWIDAQILAVSASIEAWCGRVFARETVAETWRNFCQEMVILDRAPVASITTVIEDDVTLAASDYDLDAQKGVIYRLSGDCRTWWRAQKLVVTYAGGFLLPSQVGANLPADIERACRLAVVSAFQQRGRDVMIRSESDTNIGSVSYLDPRGGTEALPPQVAGMLAPYKRWSV